MSWRTLLLLSPWILYAFSYGRLHAPDGDAVPSPRAREHVLSNPYLAFTACSSGSEPGLDAEVLQPGQGDLWVLALALTVRALMLARSRGRPALGRVRVWTALSLVVKARGLVHDSLHVTLWAWVALELILERDEGGGLRTAGALSRGRRCDCGALARRRLLSSSFRRPVLQLEDYRAWSIASSARRRSRRKARSPSASGSRTCRRARRARRPAPQDLRLTRALDLVRGVLRRGLRRRAEILLFTRAFNLNERTSARHGARTPRPSEL